MAGDKVNHIQASKRKEEGKEGKKGKKNSKKTQVEVISAHGKAAGDMSGSDSEEALFPPTAPPKIP